MLRRRANASVRQVVAVLHAPRDEGHRPAAEGAERLAAARPVVERDGMLLMVDDERMELAPGETPRLESVRFRTLGCYPLTAAVRSGAASVPEVIEELLAARTSERQGRLIDSDQVGSMEAKKRQGYF